MIEAVVFDLDGVLVDSEQLWDRSRRDVVAQRGGAWTDGATADMQGMSSTEWGRYLHDRLGVDLPAEEIVALVVSRLLDLYREDLPLLPGAREAVARLSVRWPLALASSSNRVVIEQVLTIAGLMEFFAVTVSSEEVARGKPWPDVYSEAVSRLHRLPRNCVAVEDSANGILSAAAAGLLVAAVPDPHYPPPEETLARARAVLPGLDDLTVGRLEALDRDNFDRLIDEEEEESFPASDPHGDWAGPPN